VILAITWSFPLIKIKTLKFIIDPLPIIVIYLYKRFGTVYNKSKILILLSSLIFTLYSGSITNNGINLIPGEKTYTYGNCSEGDFSYTINKENNIFGATAKVIFKTPYIVLIHLFTFVQYRQFQLNNPTSATALTKHPPWTKGTFA
jgi:hypothetical protein